MNSAFKFSTPALAKSFAAKCYKPQIVILGDDGFLWVVSMAVGNRLIRQGYEAMS